MTKNNYKEKINTQKLDFSDPNIRKFINSQKSKLEKARDNVQSHGNESERALCSQLMLVSTVLITANLIIFSSNTSIEKITGYQIALVLVGLILLFASILAGIKYYFVLIGFYRDWADAKDTAIKNLIKLDFSTWGEGSEKIESAQMRLPKRNSKKWLNFQIRCISAALIVYVVLATAILIDFRFITEK